MPQHLASCLFKGGKRREDRGVETQLPWYLGSQSSPETEDLQILPESSLQYL